MSICLLPMFVLALGQGGEPAKTAPAQATTVQDVKALIARVRKVQGTIKRFRALLVMESFVPPMLDDEKPIRFKSLIKVTFLSGPGDGVQGASSRTDFQMQTPHGQMRVETVRGPGGIRIHQASAVTGERWLKMDRELVDKLDRATREFGAEGAMGGGSSQPGYLIGAELLDGLSRTHQLELRPEIEVQGVICYHVIGKLKRETERDNMPSGMATIRADTVDLYYGKQDLVLRQMIRSHEGNRVLNVELRHLDTKATDINMSSFVLKPPDGARFQDIMEDPIASTMIKARLEKLRQLDKDKGAKDASSGSGASKNGKKL